MIADRFPRDDHQASIVSVSPFLSPLQPSHAFRLTPGHVWSTDTPSKTHVIRDGCRGSCPYAPPAARTTVPESPSMRCPRCEADTPDGAKFCIECGTPLTAPLPPVWGGHAPTRQVLCRMRHAAHRADPGAACCASPITAAVYPWVFGRENPHLQGRPRRRAQAGHRAVCRSQRLDGVAGRPRPRGGARSSSTRCWNA